MPGMAETLAFSQPSNRGNAAIITRPSWFQRFRNIQGRGGQSRGDAESLDRGGVQITRWSLSSGPHSRDNNVHLCYGGPFMRRLLLLFAASLCLLVPP